MKNIIYFIIISLLISCHPDEIIFPDSSTEKYLKILDSLKDYDDYILGEFDGNFLLSTEVHYRNFSISNSFLTDSSNIDFRIGYKLLENNIEKAYYVAFEFKEPNNKLDSVNNRYNYFSDFVNFFNRDTFNFRSRYQLTGNVHNVYMYYRDFQLTNGLYGFHSSHFNSFISPEKVSFIVDSINIIEHPRKKVEVYYSFKYIGVNRFDEELIVENGKGKSTFVYN